jgi:hypothetical protein
MKTPEEHAEEAQIAYEFTLCRHEKKSDRSYCGECLKGAVWASATAVRIDTRDHYRDEIARLRKALSLFTMAFDVKKEKLDRKWSIGYWEGTDPKLVLAAGLASTVVDDDKPEKWFENTQFNAVLQYGEEDIKEAMAAGKVEEKKNG